MKSISGCGVFALLWLALLASTAWPAAAWAMTPVRAELGKPAAWTGEGVPLIITLYSPGPFSGTASFDWPELPLTTIMPNGNPVVGSEQIDDESYLTQRHEFVVYTQQDGAVVIPPFTVRFAGKKSFLAKPEPVTASTPELRFQSRRPPGVRERQLVLTATKMEAGQDWTPKQIESLQAGDVLTRTITRRAVGAAAMMIPPLKVETPDGVRFHGAEPKVVDQVERGAALAERRETIKYQFERAGSFRLPDVSLSWWDPQAEAWQTTTLLGREVAVRDAATDAPAQVAAATGRGPRMVLLLTAGGVGCLMWVIAKSLAATYRARRAEPVAAAARQFLTACRINSAPAAYAAFLNWQRAAVGSIEMSGLSARLSPELSTELQHEWRELARQTFSRDAAPDHWSGAAFATIFRRVQRALRRSTASRRASERLPALNETSWTAPRSNASALPRRSEFTKHSSDRVVGLKRQFWFAASVGSRSDPLRSSWTAPRSNASA